MRHFQIKVCGITRTSDALLAARLGADMIGLIFHEDSPRNITLTQAKKISAALPATIDRVGVFVDRPVESILTMAEQVQLDVVQFHGPCSRKEIKRLHDCGLKVIQAFTLSGRSDWKRLADSKADMIMIDNSRGQGISFESIPPPPRSLTNLILSGGVSIQNISEGVDKFRPAVVDVNSSVESRPGVKSRVKLEQFFRKCNELRYGE